MEIKASKTQRDILQQFLENDLRNLLNECVSLKNILMSESDALNAGKPEEYKRLLTQEKGQSQKFRDILKKDGELERRFTRAYGSARYIDYNEIIAKMKHGFSKFLAQHTGYKLKILEPIGVDNIPSFGPLVIAPRHYEAGVDSAALFSAIPRRAFILAGIDWVQTGTQYLSSKLLYSGLGAIKLNRPTRPDNIKIENSPYYIKGASASEAIKQIILLLQSREAIIIFPEGWANEGRTQGHIEKPNGVLPAQDGFIVATELAQREMKQKISIIPTGIIIDHDQKTIQAVFGKPMYYEDMNKEGYRKAFGQKVMSEIKRLSGL
jgi:1-acyl-sn-glycerol-3-phosphate acyltransferase